MGWLGVVELALTVVVLLVISLLLLAARRSWLARQGGTFECSFRLQVTTPGTGWVLGVARYTSEHFEWFRLFSYSPKPRQRFERRTVRVLSNREPDALEAVSLYSDQRVVQIEVRADGVTDEWELAMSSESLTGLMSWLEAAPPGLRRDRR